MSQSPLLYHLTVHRPDTIGFSTVCEFIHGRESLVVNRGEWLEVLEIDESNESLVLKLRHNVFSVIKGLACLRCGDVDDLVVSTQHAGHAPILVQMAYDPVMNRLNRRHTYFIPTLDHRQLRPSSLNCEYLAVDLEGRVIISAALEEMRYVHFVKEKAVERRSAVLADVESDADAAMDVSVNSISSFIEHNVSETYVYELVAVNRGPSANPAYATIERLKSAKKQLALYEVNIALGIVSRVWSIDASESCSHMISLVQPLGLLVFADSNMKLISIDGSVVSSIELEEKACFTKQAGSFVFVQLESGKSLCVQFVGDDQSIVVTTISGSEVPGGISIVEVFKGGFVFTAPLLTGGAHTLFQISAMSPERCQLEELARYNVISPAISSSLAKRGSFLLGTTSNSHIAGIRQVKLGREVSELASTPLPNSPSSVLTARRKVSNTSDDFIILSFGKGNASGTTTVLAVGDGGTVEEVSESISGLASSVPTLNIAGMVSGLVQVHIKGLRYISEAGTNVMPWLISARTTTVVCSAIEPSRLVLALSDMSIVYFEEKNGVLLESQKRLRLTSPISAVALMDTVLVIALQDDTVREYSIVSFNPLKIYNVQFPVSSMLAVGTSLYVGHTNGTVSIIRDDDVAVRVVGSTSVKLSKMNGERNVLALAYPRAYMFNTRSDTFLQVHGCEGMSSACSFSTDDIDTDGLLGIVDNELRVLQLTSDSVESGICVDTIDNPENVQNNKLDRDFNLNATLGFLRNGPFSGVLSFCKSDISFIDEDKLTVNKKIPHRGCIHAFAWCRLKHEDHLVVSCDRSIIVYKVGEKGVLSFFHETRLNGECSALIGFKGMLLVAIQNRIILFDLGQKQLLFQYEVVLEMTVIKVLRSMQNIIYVGDSRKSVTYLSYSDEKSFDVIAVDFVSRAVSTLIVLDLATVCIGDHFGNIAILRFPDTNLISSIAQGNTKASEVSSIPLYLDLVSHFWVNDAIVQLHRGVISPTAATEMIIYVGLHGAVGILVPFVSQADYDSYEEIETALKSSEDRDCSNMTFRDVHTPRRNVVDGDFCEHAIYSWCEDILAECLAPIELSIKQAKNKLASIRSRY